MATKPAAQAAKPGTAVAEQGASTMVMVQDQMPDWMDPAKQRGSEAVTSDDMVIPRLELIQALSPAVKPGDPGYLDAAKPGMLMNSVTKQLYGASVHLVPVIFIKQWLVWRDRKKAKELGISTDGGFFGAYNTEQEAMDRAKQEGGEAKAITVIDTPQHFCLLLNPDTGKTEEVVMSMPRTKAKVSRQWNSMVRLSGGDRFSRVYKIGSVMEKKPDGDFYNFHVENVGFPAKAWFQAAEALYTAISAGQRQVVADVGGEDTPAAEGQPSRF